MRMCVEDYRKAGKKDEIGSDSIALLLGRIQEKHISDQAEQTTHDPQRRGVHCSNSMDGCLRWF